MKKKRIHRILAAGIVIAIGILILQVKKAFVFADAAVMDTEKPAITLTPETTDADNADTTIYGYYNSGSGGTVSVGVEISDVGEMDNSSGLEAVKYQVLCDGKETQNGSLFSFEADVTDEEPTKAQITQSVKYSGVIPVDTYKNNSSDVEVIVTAIDRTGNASKESVKLDIDVTAPTITISYDNNSANNSRYFDDTRTATIVIKERSNHFDSDDVKISITAVDAYGYPVSGATIGSMISSWKTVEGAVADTATHTAVITYSQDANYTFAISYTDTAGNKAETVNTGSSIAPYKFTVDKTAPFGTVTYSSKKGGADLGSSLLQKLSFNFYSADSILISAVSKDATSPIASVQYYKTSDKTAKSSGQLDALESTAWEKVTGLGISSDEQFVVYIKITDKAGNYTYICTDGMIVDMTIPVVEVSYDNNNAENGNYYKSSRVATITITEHNFDPERVIFTASVNGSELGMDPIWITNGDIHTTTVTFDSDGLYTFDVVCTDMAGNASADYVQDKFYVDLTNPKISISGVENESANTGTTAPVITVTDINYDSVGTRITLEGLLYGAECSCSTSDLKNGQVFAFDNIETDDIYVLTVTAMDKAGNESTESIQFSVNRNGSTYDISALEAINRQYIQSESMTDLVIVEVNPNRIRDIVVTLYKNDEAIILTEDEDYTCGIEHSKDGWYSYTYTILKEVFANDGTYGIKISSVDEAENASENILDTNSEIQFIIDNTEPTIIITNIEEDKTYYSDNYEGILVINDNMTIAKVEVTLDGKEQYEIWEGDDLQKVLDENGNYTFEIAESNFARSLSVMVTDAAGNSKTVEVERFWVTTSAWTQFYTNLPLLVGMLVGGILLSGLIIVLILFNRRRKRAG